VVVKYATDCGNINRNLNEHGSFQFLLDYLPKDAADNPVNYFRCRIATWAIRK
jgi:hypothetical protein